MGIFSLKREVIFAPSIIMVTCITCGYYSVFIGECDISSLYIFSHHLTLWGIENLFHKIGRKHHAVVAIAKFSPS